MTTDEAWERLATVIDPELGMDIVHLGLVYEVDLAPESTYVRMTLTTPGCPLHDAITGGVLGALELPGEPPVEVDVVWDPPWTPERIGASGAGTVG